MTFLTAQQDPPMGPYFLNIPMPSDDAIMVMSLILFLIPLLAPLWWKIKK